MNSIACLDQLGFPIEVIRTNRKKTATVKVVERRVQVIIPKHLCEKRLEKVVLAKTPWIRDKLYQQSLLKPSKAKEYVCGEAFAYLGKNYRLKLIQGSAEAVKLTHGKLTVGADMDVRRALVRWYMHQANNRLTEKAKGFAKAIGIVPKSISVKDYKSRWGSCSAQGDISFHWAIIMAPHCIVDYVVVHELCHMLHHNHSQAFWLKVESILPDYKECR